jgi:hypothetical protein
MSAAEAKVAKGAVLGMVIKPSSLREGLTMSLRTIVLIATSVVIGIACIVTASTESFARTPAGTTRLHHHQHHHGTVHHSGQVRLPKTPPTTSATQR